MFCKSEKLISLFLQKVEMPCHVIKTDWGSECSHFSISQNIMSESFKYVNAVSSKMWSYGAGWKEKCLLLSLVLPVRQYHRQLPQVSVWPFERLSVCTAEQSKQTSSAQCDVDAFKQEVMGWMCLTCSFSHSGLFLCVCSLLFSCLVL